LGLTSFYRTLVPNFSDFARPMTEWTRKEQPSTGESKQQEAFQRMKDRLCTAPVLAYTNFKLPFILSTDASQFSLGAILSQVQDGLERPICYASRQTNKVERAYTTSELGMLALVWATKHFRCYPHGRKFLARTDHAALKYLQKFSDQNSRLLLWSIRLSELDFVVEHKPGSKMGHVDALSRHVGSVAHDNALGKENVLREQEKDAFCIKQAPGNYRSKREFFLDDDNVLYKRKSNGNHQLVVLETLVHEVIKQNDEPMYVAHPGAKRTHDLIALQYWWSGMRKAIENYVKSCDPCQRTKGNRSRCGKSRFHRDSIPGPSSPQRVAIPTGLSRPTSFSYGLQFSQFRSSKSRTLTPSSAKLTIASRWRTMRTSTTGALWPKRDIRGSLVTTGFHSLTTRSLLPVASSSSERSRWKQRTP